MLTYLSLLLSALLLAQSGAPVGPPRGFALRIEPFASGNVGHPISLDVDRRGRVFVAETHRYTLGVRQSRGDAALEDAELRAQTVDDFKQVLIGELQRGKFRRQPDTDSTDPAYAFYADLADEVVIYEDRDGDGLADARTVFAGGFDDWYSGPGADVLVDGERVYYTCIPDLWRLHDRDGDGTAGADEREKLHTGFGVVFSFLAHDMHGLVRGPDGRLYWSIGDRSFHVQTREGRVLAGKMGAVFRCNPDGSGLELFATGLRNPQDLAFNRFGDLMTGDNNCDKGDLARICHIVEGADFGWRLPVQRARSGGPWLRERMWQTSADLAQQLGLDERGVRADATQPAWILPPLYYPDGQGPSGACVYPGLGLPSRYDDHFFLTHCAGGGGFIQSFAFAADGAGSRVVDFHVFVEPGPITGPSDALFGPDGRLYTTNWGSGWELNDDASVMVVSCEEARADPRVAATARLLGEGLATRDIDELTTLLDHVDLRVRQQAQYELVARGGPGLAALLAIAGDARAPEAARMHALWGITQQHRERHAAAAPAVRQAIESLLDDANARVRELACVAAGELHLDTAIDRLIAALGDPAARVAFQAALALSRLPAARALAGLLELLVRNDDADRYLRHAAVLALSRLADADALARLADHANRSVRLGAVLALRRQASPGLARFLADADFQVAAEAARAIWDVRVEAALPDLAATLDAGPRADFAHGRSEGLLRRAILANLHLGDAAAVARLIALADAPLVADDKRVVALESLLAWDAPPEKEEVWYDFWPARPRAPGIAATAWRAAVASGRAERIRGRSEALRVAARRLDAELLPPRPTADHVRDIEDPAENEHLRLDSLRLLTLRAEADARLGIAAALRTGTPRMRAAARAALVAIDPAAAVSELASAIGAPEVVERQAAIDALRSLCAPTVRYVRVDLPGPERILSLAEVRVLSTGRNVAPAGLATQSSVGWDGDPQLAIDGDTDGDHSVDPSVTHTRIEQDPWWELDLGHDLPVEAIEVFNRTDGGLYGRLDGAVVTLLGADRAVRWQHPLDAAPPVSARFDLALSGGAGEQASRLLADQLTRLCGEQADWQVELELVEAARAIGSETLLAGLAEYQQARVVGDALATHRVALFGGDPARGEEIFRYHPTAECLRCHAVDGVGGSVGPDLSAIGRRQDRRYLLRALLEPNADIAPGFGTIAVTLRDGRVMFGIDPGTGADGAVHLRVGEQTLRFDRLDVRERSQPVSAMLAMGESLSDRQLRDVVAWLATRTAADPPPRYVLAALPPAPHDGTLQPMQLVGLMALIGLAVSAAVALLFGRGAKA